MKRYRIVLVVVAALLAVGTAAGAQTTGTGTAVQGFNVQTLIAQLSLYLPEEATKGLYGGYGGRGAGQGAQAGASQQGAGSQASGARQRFQVNFTRDTKLFFTKEQIAKLLPVMQGLKDNPMPSPSKAKQVQADVDAILTAAQKAEYTEFQKEMEKLIASFRQQMSVAGSTAAGTTAGAGAFGGDQEQGTQASRATGQSSGAAQLTPLQRRERQVEAFIQVLQDRQKQLGA